MRCGPPSGTACEARGPSRRVCPTGPDGEGRRDAGGRPTVPAPALPPAGGPRSLGVLGQDKLLTLTAAEQEVKQVPTLAISLEPKGGVPSEGGPTGPVLFKGALIQRML